LLFSSLLSLIIGTVVGLTQSRIKRLFAFSTISHVGFILLGLSIHTVESIQAFIFYLIQYSISNLNAFFLIITIGYSLYCYVHNEKSKGEVEKEKEKEKEKKTIEKSKLDMEKAYEKKTIEKEVACKGQNSTYNNSNLTDVNNSPIQIIDQLKGYYYINPILSLSLGITLFSFAGIPPLIGFFGKQMILSAAIDNGYIFMALVAILTSVISAVYYLSIIKQIFFDKPDYTLNDELKSLNVDATIRGKIVKLVQIKMNNIFISTSLSLAISVITLFITLFIFIPEELLSLANILALILFNL